MPRAKRNRDGAIVVAGASSSKPPPRGKNSRGSALRAAKGGCKDIILPGIIISPTLDHCDMNKLVHELGLSQFFTMDEIVCPNLVKAFYKGLKVHIDDEFVNLEVKYNGVTKVYGSDDFYDDFQLGCVGFGEYAVGSITPHTEAVYMENVRRFNRGEYAPNWRYVHRDKVENMIGGVVTYLYAHGHRSFLDGEEYLIFKLVRDGIIPTKNKALDATRNELAIFLALKDKKRLNLLKIIAHHMYYSISNKKTRTLPYGMLVTKIMKKWQLLKGIEDENLRGLVIDLDACRRFCLYLDPETRKFLTKKQREALGQIPVTRPSTSKKGKEKMDARDESVLAMRREARSYARVHRENQGRLAKGLNAIMRAILCQCKGKEVDEASLEEVTLVDLEEFEDLGDEENEEEVNEESEEEGEDEASEEESE